MLIDLTKLSKPDVYFTMTQTVLPRPIAWVLTRNENESFNLAPFSYFNAVCTDPPLLMFSVGLQDDGSAKDTLRNLKRESQLVIHIASCSQLDDLNQSSATLPAGESEVTFGNLETVPVDGHEMPRLAECKVAYLCRLHKIQEIGNNLQSLVFAEIDNIYVEDDCIEINDKGRLTINADVIQPLSRLGANQYSTFGEVITVKRPA